MQLYETIDLLQPSNTIIHRGKPTKSSQQIKEFNEQRYMAFREFGDRFPISWVEYSWCYVSNEKRFGVRQQRRLFKLKQESRKIINNSK